MAIVATARFPIAEPLAGGLEMHTFVLAQHLAERGHAVTVYASGGDGPFRVETMLPVDFEASPVARRDIAAPPATMLSEHHSYLDAMLRLGEGGHDVVHVNAIHYLPFVSGGLLRAPMVGTLHSPPTPWLESALALARHSRRPPHVVSVSASNAAAWGDGIVDEVIHNGVDLERWRRGPGGDGVVWTGRLAPEKAPHLAIDAAVRAGRPIELHGPIFDEAYFARHVAPRLGREVVYAGHTGVDGLVAAVGHAAVAVVTPAWEEPFGLVVVEALACGTPVASFDRGAISELVDGRTGRLAGPGDTDGLAAAITAAADLDRDDCREAAEQRYSAAVMAERYERTFTSSVDRLAA